ncbi:RNA-guided endonuclease TnpB family protein [Gloeocapsopsis sp. IPPAS B-1203]|uniref:RNA-guided endonuclease InsQ/TnpB family protein n=1 Tax=Gloeocapsopsis sp. IPPAS B-1203 TaxID=2049454 RepID=UPI000C19604B|nr:RNA-guided endonuclease TnpB family protein [Gloeocapsopsis sp. IPPAS B-1203]PIG93685.1 transposase [Gloeocapsopsis sp. IPPAS B-1203]
MIVREAKLLNGTKSQYQAIDDAIKTAQFIRNKAVRYWIDNQNVGKADLYKLCKDLAKEFSFAHALNSAARQASAERAWASISNFYTRCKKGEKKKGYPKFKKHCRSVEYKVSGWKLSDDGMSIVFTDGFKIGSLSLYCNKETREDLLRLKINRVRVVRRADGYYAQFCFDADRKEVGQYTGNVVGLDLGLKYFTKDQNDNAVSYPQFLRKSERRLKKAQKRLSKKFVKGKKPQSNNYHKARNRCGRVHLKIQRQRKDWAIKTARCVVHSNDVVVYEDLKIANMVKNHHLAKSISDVSWYQFTQWLDYYGKIWDKAVVAVPPNYTSQDCSSCGHRVKKSLSTRTHSCPRCKVEICRDTNAAINILKKGMKVLGVEWQSNSTSGQEESGSIERKLGEKTTSTIDEQSDIASGLLRTKN